MDCPHCRSPHTTPLKRITNLGYAVYCCKDCHRSFNDGLSSYSRAIREEPETEVKHEAIPCLGNPIEQSHLEIKQRYYPTLSFGIFESAKRFCQAYDEMHQFFLPRQRMAEFVSLSDR